MLVLVCGPPGSGKTTITTALRARLAAAGYDFAVFHSDDYQRRTYERLEADVERHDGHVIVDGTFYKPAWRERFRSLADDVFVLRVTADLDTCLRRNYERETTIDEAGVRTIHAALQEEPVDADFTVDTDILDVETAVSLAAERIENQLTQ